MNDNPVATTEDKSSPRKRTMINIFVAVVIYVIIQTLVSQGVIG